MNLPTDQSVLYGCILIGGASRRMGQPKHLIVSPDGRSWLERAVDILSPVVEQILISGAGEVPRSLQHLTRIADLETVPGPLSGIGAAFKAYPDVSWLVLACDMPRITSQSISWLLDQRADEHLAVVPRNPLTGKSEPLFAWYGRQSRFLIEQMIDSGCERISGICSYEQVHQPVIPAEYRGSWRNYNRQEELGNDDQLART